MEPELGISVVITTYKNADYISDLLDSLVNQEQPYEVVIVDSRSPDGTDKIIKSYSERYGFVRLISKKCSRGEGRNIGVREAKYDYVLFTDGDAIANAFWIKNMREKFREGASIAAGKTIQMGYGPFEKLERVELFFEDYDVTYPSVNLGYRRDLFLKVGGFDPRFVTAEDIDLNIRGVMSGAKIEYCNSCVIYHRARSTVMSFIEQAFWNGFGRKQLTTKHKRVWGHFRASEILKPEVINFWYILRASSAMIGYIACKIFGDEFVGIPSGEEHSNKAVEG